MPKNRNIFLLSTVTMDTVRPLMDQILSFVHESPDDPIRLYVSGGGGKYYVAEAFYEFVRMNNVRLETLALSSVSMTTIVVYASGIRRFAGETAEFSFLPMTRTYENKEMEYPKLQQESAEIQRHEEKVPRVIRYASGCPVEKLIDLCHAKTVLSAQQAKDIGLVRDIIPHEQQELIRV